MIILNNVSLRELLVKNPVKDVRFEYNTVVLILSGGHEVEILSEMEFDTSCLTIEHYVVERKEVGRAELN